MNTPKGTCNADEYRTPGTGEPWLPGAWLTWAGWALALWAILAYHNFNIAFRFDVDPPRIPLAVIQGVLLAGLAFMVLGFRRMPDRKLPDPGRLFSRCTMAVILGASAFLYFYNGDTPMGSFWDDWSQNVSDARNILDYDRHKLIFHPGGREGFHVYLIAAIWWLFPFLKGLAVLRIASGVVVLATVWVAYLIGKELGSRRTGLMLAALVAVGKPLLQQALAGMRIETQVLAAAVACLMFLRVAKRPKLRRFVACGLAMGFGAYTYTGFRSWIMFLPFLFLLWSVTRKGELRAGWQDDLLPFLVLWLHGHYFIGRHLEGMVPLYSPMADLWNSSVLLRGSFFLVLLAALLKAVKVHHLKKAGTWTTGWSLGVLAMLLILYPAMQDPGFAQKISQSSVLATPQFHEAPLATLAHKTALSLRCLFVLGEDRNDLALSFEPYLDFYSMAAVVLGLALFAARPDRRGLLFLLLALAGMFPHVVSRDMASTRIIGVVFPLYVLGAMAGERLFAASAALRPGRPAKALAASFLLLLFGAGVWMQFEKFHVLWVSETNPNTALSRQVRELSQKGIRVYLATPDSYWGGGAQSILNEGLVYYPLLKSNEIELNEGEPVPPVALLINPEAKAAIRTLKERFPRAAWVPIARVSRFKDRSTPCQIFRVELTEKDITGDPGRLLTIRRKAKSPWVRRYYSGEYGTYGRSFVQYEDRVGKMSVPVDKAVMRDPAYVSCNGLHTVRVFGHLKAEQDGVYRMQWKQRRHIWIKVDGSLAADYRSRAPVAIDREIRLDLKAGEHPVEFGVNFGDEFDMPEVFLTRPGAPVPEVF